MAEPTAGFSLNVLTINTHKGFTAFNRRFILPELRDAVRSAVSYTHLTLPTTERV